MDGWMDSYKINMRTRKFHCNDFSECWLSGFEEKGAKIRVEELRMYAKGYTMC